MSSMKDVRIEKLTLNIGAGKDQSRLEKGIMLIKNLTGMNAVKTFSNKRIPEWGIRPGLAIGCKLTLRKKKAEEILVRFLDAKNNTLKKRNFDDNGNVSFGIHEYIDIKDAKYDPKIGVMGLEVCITLERAGFRIKRKKNRKSIAKRHLITKEDAISFMSKKFNVKLEEES